MEKVCSSCRTMRSLTAFSKRNASADGLSYICKTCASAERKGRYAKNKDLEKQQMRAYAAANKDRITEYHANWRAANRDKVNHNATAWQKRNPEKTREIKRVVQMRRNAAKCNASVSWDTELTALIDAEANRLAALREQVTGYKWHVDHIIPLRGKHVSGLHVWNNLQVIPAAVNVRKSNHFEVAA